MIGREDFGPYLWNNFFNKHRLCRETQQMIEIFLMEQIK